MMAIMVLKDGFWVTSMMRETKISLTFHLEKSSLSVAMNQSYTLLSILFGSCSSW